MPSALGPALAENSSAESGPRETQSGIWRDRNNGLAAPTLPPVNVEPDVRGVLEDYSPVKETPPVRFHVHSWEGILGGLALQTRFRKVP